MREHVSPMHAGAFPLRFNDNTRKHERTAEHFTVSFRVTSAIPEPSTVVTLGGLLGMGLVAGWWRRRRKAAQDDHSQPHVHTLPMGRCCWVSPGDDWARAREAVESIQRG